jgi:hypothetical protein
MGDATMDSNTPAPEPTEEQLKTETHVAAPVVESQRAPEKEKKHVRPTAVLYSYPPIVYIWPVILLGFLFWFTDHFGMLSPKFEAWAYAITVVIVLMTMGLDINRNMAAFWLVVIAAVWFLVLWLRGVKGFVFFDRIGLFFENLQPVYSADLGILISIFLAVIYVIIVVTAHINDKWVFSENEIEHYALFRGSNSLGRGAKGVTASYRDFFEIVLLLAGDVEVRTAQGNRVLARIKNVPFLWFRMRKIDRILSSIAVTTGAADEESSEHGEDEVF